MNIVRKQNRKGGRTGKQGKAVPGNEKIQRKEEAHRSMRKTVGFFTSQTQAIRMWTKLIQLGLVGQGFGHFYNGV